MCWSGPVAQKRWPKTAIFKRGQLELMLNFGALAQPSRVQSTGMCFCDRTPRGPWSANKTPGQNYSKDFWDDVEEDFVEDFMFALHWSFTCTTRKKQTNEIRESGEPCQEVLRWVGWVGWASVMQVSSNQNPGQLLYYAGIFKPTQLY